MSHARICQSVLFVLLAFAILIAPSALADSTLSYGVEAACSPCMEGKPANLTLRVFFDVPGMNDQQYLIYNGTTPSRQTYTSKITVTRVVLRDKLSNTTFLDRNTSLVFADRRIKRSQALRAEPQEIFSNVILPKPTQLETLSFLPCFTLEYEHELRQYDAVAHDFERRYVTDTLERCGTDIAALHVLPKPVHMCVQQDCSWFAVCDPTEGCRLSALKMSITLLIALAILIIGVRFIVQEPPKRQF